MNKWQYEFQVQQCPTEIVGIVAMVDYYELALLLDNMKRDGYSLQPESSAEAYGTLIFVRSKRVDFADWTTDTCERLADLNIWTDEDLPGAAKLLEELDPAKLKVLVRAVLLVAP